MIIKNNPERTSADQVVLFAFDDFSLPFQNGLRLHFVPFKSKRDRSRIAVEPGPSGTPDCERVFNGVSVARVGDELYMWYHGQGEDGHTNVCFAKSSDGYTWQKPHLGLLKYNGSTNNNVLDVPDGELHRTNCAVVLYDPSDANPSRRFKAVMAVNKRLAATVSEDGMQWKEIDPKPELPLCEVSGGMIFNGCYYLCGHGGGHFGAPRQLVMFTSYDFERWTEATCLGFRRENIPPKPMAAGFNEGEQVHGGAALWNRGNVVIGLYGQWHGPANNDRRHIDMDLGLVISNDALHYKEPIPDFRMVDAAEDGFEALPSPMKFKHSGLVQGQGFENLGDETLFWYAPWPEHLGDGIRVASWKRDRLGYLQANPGAYQLRSAQACHLISAPIDLEGQCGQVALNIDDLSEYAKVSVEILDEFFKPLKGYSSKECLPIESGLQQRVTWKNHKLVEKKNGAFRIRLNYSGIRPEDPKLYAIYVTNAG